MAQNTAGQTLTQANPNGVVFSSAGRVVFDATAITAADYVEITLGFTPTYVCWENITDRVKGEWYVGMADESCIKTVAAGTRTLEVTGGNKGITVIAGGFRVAQNATLALILASKVCGWKASA